MSQEAQIELSVVEAYEREQQDRRAEMLHWIAEELEKAFEALPV